MSRTGSLHGRCGAGRGKTEEAREREGKPSRKKSPKPRNAVAESSYSASIREKLSQAKKMEDMKQKEETQPNGKGKGKDTTRVSRHVFGDDPEKPVFSISIVEDIKEEYGLFVWPSSVVLAEYVWQQRGRFSGASVVELGAGTSLSGLVAAELSSRVVLTDDEGRSEVLNNMRRTCDLNELQCQVLGLTWGMWDEPIFSLKPEIILGADVLYDSSAFDDLFATVTFLLQKRPGATFITTYHDRSGHHLIEYLLLKWGLKCVKLLDGFSLMPSYKASGLSGNIQLAEIELSRE